MDKNHFSLLELSILFLLKNDHSIFVYTTFVYKINSILQHILYFNMTIKFNKQHLKFLNFVTLKRSSTLKSRCNFNKML